MVETSKAKRGRVMIVDDDPITLEVTRERLEEAGYEVLVRDAALGTSAAVMRERPDFVLLDVNMPALGGEALAKMLCGTSAGCGASVILYSGVDTKRLAQLAADCGALGAVQKTAQRAALPTAVRTLHRRIARATGG